MIMFTTSCFIRKNTPELRKKLEELGYKYSTTGGIKSNNIVVLYGCIFDIYPIDTIKRGFNNCVDCGTNEELFIALAALRDHTDKDQWFTDGIDWTIWREYSSFRGKSIAGFEFHYLPSNTNYNKYHKATVKEIIEHFTMEGGAE